MRERHEKFGPAPAAASQRRGDGANSGPPNRLAEYRYEYLLVVARKLRV